MPRKPSDYPIGDRLPGTKYVVARKLGAGGMGAVYEVVKEPEIRGALKIISPKLARRPDFVKRFFEEVRIVARLKHPNIVQVFDCDTLDDGTPFFVMELLDGKTLHQAFIDRRRAIPATLAYEIVRQLCEALERVHSHAPPVVHRDIKPQNIFLHRPEYGDPAVKILDFGVAAILDSDHSGGFFGTLRYASPEQFRGERPTIRADIYSTALVLYEMLAGRGPFDDEKDLSIAQMRVEPPRLRRFAPWVPQTVDDLMAQALSKDPEKRPRSAYAFISKLFELQWVNDGSRARADINTTAPTLTAIIDAEGAAPPSGNSSASGRSNDTFRGMTPPPVEGPTLECLPPELSPETLERMEAPRQIVHVSPSGADADAATRTDPASLRGAPTRTLGATRGDTLRLGAVGAADRPATEAMSSEEHARANAAARQHATPPGSLRTPVPAPAAPLQLASEAGTARSVATDSVALPRRSPIALYLAIPATAAMIAVAGWFAFAPRGNVAPAAAISAAPTSSASIAPPPAVAPSASPSVALSAAPSASMVAAPAPASAAPMVRVTTTAPVGPPVPIKTSFGSSPSQPSAPVAAPLAPKSPDDGRDLLFEPGHKP